MDVLILTMLLSSVAIPSMDIIFDMIVINSTACYFNIYSLFIFRTYF